MPQPDRPAPAPRRRGLGTRVILLFGVMAADLMPLIALDAPESIPAGRSAGPSIGTALLRRTVPAADGAPGTIEPPRGGFETALRSRLAREARRQGVDQPRLPMTPFGLEEGDDAAESGRRAGRTILRSLRGALDDHLETAARGSGSFATLFRFLDARGAAPTSPIPVGDAAAPVAAVPRGGADFGVRFRIDAHPRLVVGGRLGRLEGRFEVPILDREIRMAVEHPIGGYGGAALRGGHSLDRGSWADLSLTLHF